MAKKIKKYKVGMDSETYKISMVSEPAIEVDYVALSKQDEEVQVKLSSDERHICYGPALIPNKDIYRNNGEQEFYINFTEESIVKMSQDFMKNYKQHEVNLQHEENVDEVYVCESWIVEDPYKDKANALGFNVPKNTWMVGMKVNNIDTWERVKSGELRGFSVESAIHLEEFNKIENDNDMEVNDESFWSKLKSVLAEAFKKEEKEDETNVIESTNIELEEQVETPKNEPAVEPQEPPKVEEPIDVKEEPKEGAVDKTVEEPKEEPKQDNSHLEELINNLKDEITALKEMNSGLQDKIKELGKKPSAKPVNTNSKPTPADTYAAWREKMREYVS